MFDTIDADTFRAYFEPARRASDKIREATSEFSHEPGTTYRFGSERARGIRGYAVRADGELVFVFSCERGNGDEIVSDAVASGALYLDCFDGYLPTLYARHGFEVNARVPNWTPGGPDVVLMSRPAVYTKECRHLLYWADAIIDQHVQGLPIYEGGARSPRIAELEAEVSRLKSEGSDEVREALSTAKSTIDSLNERLSVAQRNLENSIGESSVVIDRIKRNLTAEIADLTGQNSDLTTKLQEAERTTHVLGAVLVYVAEIIEDETTLANLLGYWTGIDDATPEA